MSTGSRSPRSVVDAGRPTPYEGGGMSALLARYALRRLLRDRAFAATAWLTLGLGIELSAMITGPANDRQLVARLPKELRQRVEAIRAGLSKRAPVAWALSLCQNCVRRVARAPRAGSRGRWRYWSNRDKAPPHPGDIQDPAGAGWPGSPVQKIARHGVSWHGGGAQQALPSASVHCIEDAGVANGKSRP